MYVRRIINSCSFTGNDQSASCIPSSTTSYPSPLPGRVVVNILMSVSYRQSSRARFGPDTSVRIENIEFSLVYTSRTNRAILFQERKHANRRSRRQEEISGGKFSSSDIAAPKFWIPACIPKTPCRRYLRETIRTRTREEIVQAQRLMTAST